MAPQGTIRRLGARGVSLETLARQLQTEVGVARVVDQTGLEGKFDYRIDFVALNARSDDDTPYPTIFTALEKDLGLKLEPTKLQLDTIVIDHIERPSEN